MRYRILFCLLGFSLLGGCAPLQQAPLVYASKIAVGIDISGTSTEAPGVSLTVGYKQVDAAYVPVAVAKSCDDKATTCTDKIYELRTVSGDSTTEGTSRAGPSDDEAKKAIKEYETAVQQLSTAKLNRDAALERSTQLQRRKADLAARNDQFEKQSRQLSVLETDRKNMDAKKVSSTITDEDLKLLQDLERQIEQLKATGPKPLTLEESKELSAIDSTMMAGANEAIQRTTAALIPLESEVERLRPQARAAEQKLDSLRRKDAFSVYGRFEGSTLAEPSKASVGLGKVFSTGVASQNLSQGLGDYYRSLGVAACYEAVAKLSEKITESTVIQRMLADCRSNATLNPKTP
jgi:hypothetical protein